MGTVTDYFSTDETHDLKITADTVLASRDGLKIPIRIFQDFSAGAVYFALHLPVVSNALERCIGFLNDESIGALLRTAPELDLQSDIPPAVPIPTSSLKFCGRMYIYSDNLLSANDIALLHAEGRKCGIFLQYFGPEWAAQRSASEKPLAFLSYDSRDRDRIARPLALELSKRGVPVWFDEFALKVGDSLREKIETGLKECKRCILIISPQFLANTGWTKREFDSVFTRELLDRKKVVLPIWVEVEQRSVYEYSPTLADKVALRWSLGIKRVADALASEIRTAG